MTRPTPTSFRMSQFAAFHRDMAKKETDDAMIAFHERLAMEADACLESQLADERRKDAIAAIKAQHSYTIGVNGCPDTTAPEF